MRRPPARQTQRKAARTRADALNGDGLGTLCRGRELLLGRVEGGVEEGVDECRLAESGLAWVPVSKT